MLTICKSLSFSEVKSHFWSYIILYTGNINLFTYRLSYNIYTKLVITLIPMYKNFKIDLVELNVIIHRILKL